jgi:hypothetical protein
MAQAQRQELLDATNAGPEAFIKLFNSHVSLGPPLTLFQSQNTNFRFNALAAFADPCASESRHESGIWQCLALCPLF